MKLGLLKKKEETMNIVSEYNYRKCLTTKTIFELVQQKGKSIEILEKSVCSRGVNQGKKTITLRKMQEYKLSSRFEFCISGKNAEMITGFNPTVISRKYYGNTSDKQYTILIETDLKSYINLYFVQKIDSKSDRDVFNDWITEEKK